MINVFYSNVESFSFILSLGLSFLQAAVARRLRRCAATLPHFWEKTFLGSTFSFVFLVTAVLGAAVSMKGSMRWRFFVAHPNKICPRPEMFPTHPPYWPLSTVLRSRKCQGVSYIEGCHRLRGDILASPLWFEKQRKNSNLMVFLVQKFAKCAWIFGYFASQWTN